MYKSKRKTFVSYAPIIYSNTTYDKVIERKAGIVDRLRNIYSKQEILLKMLWRTLKRCWTG